METEYLQVLDPVAEGHPVRASTESTAARPVLKRLAEEARLAFLSAYASELAAAYPALPNGLVLFSFRRLVFYLEEICLMPALLPTSYEGTVVWLGAQPEPVEKLVIRAVPLQEMSLGFAGFQGESHAGLTRPACSRVKAQHPRETEIRNVRQMAVVSAEEMAEVAVKLGLEAMDHAWVGASLVVSGIPDFSHLPPSSRLQGPDGVTLVIDMQNRPCQEPAVTIEKARPGHGKAFKAAAEGKRGVTAWVEREGVLRIGDRITLHIPDQRPWAHLDAARRQS